MNCHLHQISFVLLPGSLTTISFYTSPPWDKRALQSFVWKILCLLREFEVLCLLFIETKIQYTNQLRAVLPHMPIKNLCHTGWHIWQRFVWWIKNYNVVLIPNFIFQIYFFNLIDPIDHNSHLSCVKIGLSVIRAFLLKVVPQFYKICFMTYLSTK